MNDLRIISREQFIKSYHENSLSPVADFDDLPSISEAVEVCEALIEYAMTIDNKGVGELHCIYCGAYESSQHLVACPVTKARNFLAKVREEKE